MTKKQNPPTLQQLEKKFLPKVDNTIKAELAKFKYDIDEKFESLGKKIDHLPTKEEYFTREDKTMGELKKISEELTTTKDLYEKTNKRVDKIDKHVGIDTSVVF